MKQVKKYVVLFCMLVFTCRFEVFAKDYSSYTHYMQGLIYMNENKFQEAENEFEKTIAVDKNAVAAYKELIRVYLQLGKYDKAQTLVKKLDSISDDIDTRLFLGKYYAFVEDNPSAIIKYEAILKQEPNNKEALIILSGLCSNSEPSKALKYLDRYAGLVPDSSEIYYNRAVLLRKLGKNNEAKKALEQGIEKYPDEIILHTTLAELYESEKDYIAAANELRGSIELDKENIALYLSAGGLYILAKDYVKAEEIFTEALKVRKNDPTLFYWLGLIYEQQENWHKAIEYFGKSVNLKPNASVYLRLSYYYTRLNNVPKAVEILEKAIKIEKNSPEVYFFLGLGYLDMKKYSKAEKAFLKTMKIEPKFVDAYFFLGTMYEQKKKYDKAVLNFRKVIEFDPKNAAALNYLGYSFAERNINLEESESLINRALVLDSENGAYLDSLGWVYFRKGRYKDAQIKLLQAIRILHDPVIYEHLGDVERVIGNTQNAFEYYEKAFILDKNNRNLQKKLKQLKRYK